MTWGAREHGDVLVRREVLKGHVWLAYPTFVVRDEPDLLVTYLASGARFTFPAWPFDRWEHPWRSAGHTSWTGHGKLMLHRPGDAYSVEVFWRGREREHVGWYLNLQEPVRRTSDGFDTLDHELDYWVEPSGEWRVKDAELFEQRVAEDRYTPEQAEEVRRTGRALEAMLDSGETWWDPAWADWTPEPGWDRPAVVRGT
jgi:hypothetical protein